VRLGIW